MRFLDIHHSDRRLLAVVVLLGILAVAVILWNEDKPLVAESLHEDNDTTTTAVTPEKGGGGSYYFVPEKQAETFAFDPNTADSTALLRLGLQPWQVRSIYRFRAKGGVFSRVEDLARVPGMTQGDYSRLAPYVRISQQFRPAAELLQNRKAEAGQRQHLSAVDSVERPRKLQAGQTVALNSADTTTLKRVPGIGSYWARRIVDYRRQLGGFASVAQLKELDGFPIDALAYMSLPPDDMPVNRLTVNRLTIEQLAHHPYMRLSQARAIVNHCRRHGPITSIEELRMMPQFTESDLDRLSPYLSFE